MLDVRASPVSTGLARVYAWCVRGADRVHAHRVAVCLIGAPLITLALVAINQLVLLDFPNSGDEYVYLYQARTMAGGRLWNAPVTPADIFAVNYIVQEPLRTFGSFPVGWPLALAAALAIHVPAWLVNPYGALTLGLVWLLGARLYTPRVGVLAAVLVAVSPFFAFNAASYSRTRSAARCCSARHVWRRARTARRGGCRSRSALLVGWAVLARYLPGVVGAVPVVFWLMRPGVSRARTAALVVLGGLPWIAVLMAYNAALSGSPWRLTTRPITLSLWFADGFALRGADILSTHLLRHLLWTPPMLIVAYVVYLRVAPRETRRGLFEWMLVLMAGVLYFYVERGGNQYGPRFHYEVFPFVGLFLAANVFRERDLAEKPPGAPMDLRPVGPERGADAGQFRGPRPDRAAGDPGADGSLHPGGSGGAPAGAGADRRTGRHEAVDRGVRPHAQRPRPPGQRALRPRPG